MNNLAAVKYKAIKNASRVDFGLHFTDVNRIKLISKFLNNSIIMEEYGATFDIISNLAEDILSSTRMPALEILLDKMSNNFYNYEIKLIILDLLLPLMTK